MIFFIGSPDRTGMATSLDRLGFNAVLGFALCGVLDHHLTDLMDRA